MSGLLKIIGIISGIITVLVGIFSAGETDSIFVFLTCLVTGAVQVVIYFAVAKVLDNQDDMLWRLYYIEQKLDPKKKDATKKKACPSCGKSYDEDRVSCPYCGYKE